MKRIREHASKIAPQESVSSQQNITLPWECTAWSGWTGAIGGAAHFAARCAVVLGIGVVMLVLVGVVGLLAGAGRFDHLPPTGAIAAEAVVETNSATSAVVDTRAVTTTAHVAATNAHADFLARFVEWFVACALLLVGMSLLLRARAWMSAFSSAIAHPLAPILSGLYAMLMGLVIVLAHNIWVGDARVLVTIIGWVSLVFGAFFLLVPEAYGAVLRRIPITPQFVALRGLLRIGLGGAIATYLLTQG